MLLLLSVALAAGCLSPDKGIDCNTMLDRQLRSECVYNRSIAARNPAFCKDIPDMDIRIKCVDDISIKLGNDMYCLQHERLSAREACERKVADANRLRKEQATKTT